MSPRRTRWAVIGRGSQTGSCFEGILRRLVTGCSWDVAARITGAGETTLRRRRSEWTAAGVFEKLRAESTAAYDRIIGLDLTEIAIDGLRRFLCATKVGRLPPVAPGCAEVATEANQDS